MYRDGEIIKITCPKCNKIREFKYRSPENFGKDTDINENPGQLSSRIFCNYCKTELKFPG